MAQRRLATIERAFLTTTVALVVLAALPQPTSGESGDTAAPAPLQVRSHGYLLGFTARRVYTVGEGYALVEEFVGARPVQPVWSAAAHPTGARSASDFQPVTYSRLWDGISVSYASNPNGFAESTYRLEPHADARRIRLRYNTNVALQADGSLRLHHPTAKGYFTLSAPKAWQESGGRRVPVAVAYAQRDDRVVGFTVGSYDPSHPLVIDPIYSWQTFVGSLANDRGYSIDLDGSGNVYVVGESLATWGAPLHAHSAGGAPDIVVMKFDNSGTLMWHTFYGSAGSGPGGVDNGFDLAVDESGAVYVTGTSHGAWNGPSGQSPLHGFGGYQDIVVLKLDGAGTYQWHTFYGSSEWSLGNGIAVDGSSAVYVAGTSYSSWGTPTHPHGPNGWDAVVLKLNSAGALQWNTFAGASGGNFGYDIAVDGSAAYVTGRSQTTWGTPLHPHSGSFDAFVMKVSSTGVHQWHTLYGSAGEDEGRGIAVDGSGNPYMAGSSGGTWGTPLYPHSGGNDIAVLKFDSSGTLLWHTFYGGAGHDSGVGIAVDSSGTVDVTGGSWGTWGIPLNPHNAYGWDIVVLELDSTGAYQWHTYYGANASIGSDPGDVGQGIARDGRGDVYVTGYSNATWGSPLLPYSGTLDIVVLKLANWAFIDVTDVALSTVQTSNVATVTGIADDTPIAVSGDASSQYAINGGAWTSAPGTVDRGDTVRVRHVSAGTHSASVDTTLTIGAASDTFTSTTLAAVAITGTVRTDTNVALAGVTLTLSGSISATTTSAANGTYSFAGLPSGATYTVTPGLPGRVFEPIARTFASMSTNQVADFVGHRVFAISGQVRDLNDTGVAGVTLTLSGSQGATAATDLDGYYAFSDLVAGGTYTVTPSKSTFTFNPGNQTFPNLAQDEVAGFFVAQVGTFTRYFAEGATSTFFDTRFALLNATGHAATATVRFQRPASQPEVATTVALGGLQRVTIDPKDLGLTQAEFSTVIEADQPILADRTMTWDASGYGSHAETSIGRPLTQWFLAEGATHSGFDLFYLIQNPGDITADMQVRYLLPAPAPPVVKTYTIPARSRFNIWVNTEDARLAAAEVSAALTVTNGVPVIVERAMYRPVGGQVFGAGHESAGVEAPALAWYFAEGATGPFLDLFFLVANPTDQASHVNANYLKPDGTVVTRTYEVAANSRFNIWVDFEGPALADTAVATTFRVTNAVPVVIERALWWPGDVAQWHEGHNAAGATATGEKWGLAEGQVGGPTALETYVLIGNTSAWPGTARVTLTFENGAQSAKDVALPPNSRTNVAVGIEFPEASGRRFGTVVESLGPTPAQLVVERAMYNDAGGVVWAAGTSAMGTLLRADGPTVVATAHDLLPVAAGVVDVSARATAVRDAARSRPMASCSVSSFSTTEPPSSWCSSPTPPPR